MLGWTRLKTGIDDGEKWQFTFFYDVNQADLYTPHFSAHIYQLQLNPLHGIGLVIDGSNLYALYVLCQVDTKIRSRNLCAVYIPSDWRTPPPLASSGLGSGRGKGHRPAGSVSMGGASDSRQPDLPPAEEQLTEREVQVLALVARGLSNQEIAEQLVIGPDAETGMGFVTRTDIRRSDAWIPGAFRSGFEKNSFSVASRGAPGVRARAGRCGARNARPRWMPRGT